MCKKYIRLKLFRKLGSYCEFELRGYEVWLSQIRIGFLSILITIGIVKLELFFV